MGGGRKRKKQISAREIAKFRQRVGNKQQQELWEEEERERKKQISAREITKFRQRVDNKQQQEFTRRKKEKETNISKGNNKV